MPDAQQKRRFLAVTALVFMLLLSGCSALSGSFDGTGELTVEVVNKKGEAVERQTVTVRNTETEKVVFEGRTGPNGKVSTTLEGGKYIVAAEDTTHTVKIDEDTESITLSVAPTPPNPNEPGDRTPNAAITPHHSKRYLHSHSTHQNNSVQLTDPEHIPPIFRK